MSARWTRCAPWQVAGMCRRSVRRAGQTTGHDPRLDTHCRCAQARPGGCRDHPSTGPARSPRNQPRAAGSLLVRYGTPRSRGVPGPPAWAANGAARFGTMPTGLDLARSGTCDGQGLTHADRQEGDPCRCVVCCGRNRGFAAPIATVVKGGRDDAPKSGPSTSMTLRTIPRGHRSGCAHHLQPPRKGQRDRRRHPLELVGAGRTGRPSTPTCT